IGHDVVELPHCPERILVVGVRLAYLAFEAMDGKVHLAETHGLVHALLSINREPTGLAVAVLVHKPGALHEHTAGAARGIEDLPAERLNDLHDQPDDRRWREVLATLRPFN